MSAGEAGPPGKRRRMAQLPQNPTIPLMADLRGRRCLVVGDTEAATARAALLADAGAEVVRRSELGGADLEGVWLVFAATGSASIDAAVTAQAHDRHILANAHDQPAACTFHMPAFVKRGALSVAVGTGGAVPALAAKVRDLLAEALGPRLEALVDEAAQRRVEAKQSGQSPSELDWDSILAPVLDAIRVGFRSV